MVRPLSLSIFPLLVLLPALGLGEEASRTPQSDPRIEASTQAIQVRLQKDLRERIFESASFGWIQEGSVVAEVHVGNGSSRSIYDLASLTKPLFSTTAIALLAQKNVLRISDLVARHLPAWQSCVRPGRSCEWRRSVTVEQLLRHRSGLSDGASFPGDVGVSEKVRRSLRTGGDWRAIFKDVYPVRPPGIQFVYQDVNFITLLEVARHALKASGSDQSLEDFVHQEVLSPLMMKSSFARKVPPDLVRDTIRTMPGLPAGQVHDPIARMIPEQVGHAGFFSNLQDLLRFASLLLQGGKWENRQIFTEASIEGFGSGGARGLGWDVSSDYAGAVRGPFREGFGHTGYTGTSLWVIPGKKVAWILLTNRTFHGDGPLHAARHRGRGQSRVRSSVDTKVRIRELREFVATRIHEAQLKN